MIECVDGASVKDDVREISIPIVERRQIVSISSPYTAIITCVQGVWISSAECRTEDEIALIGMDEIRSARGQICEGASAVGREEDIPRANSHGVRVRRVNGDTTDRVLSIESRNTRIAGVLQCGPGSAAVGVRDPPVDCVRARLAARARNADKSGSARHVQHILLWRGRRVVGDGNVVVQRRIVWHAGVDWGPGQSAVGRSVSAVVVRGRDVRENRGVQCLVAPVADDKAPDVIRLSVQHRKPGGGLSVD